ncbi:MAG: isoaspartyl peptidase/L-asparaginase [Flavobacteriaceae bacterium]|nr:isoaspartyl peptidase/L-asparaginase [Flavobacteriaceae bacterium]
MRYTFYLLSFVFLLSCETKDRLHQVDAHEFLDSNTTTPIAIALHGGAGWIKKGSISDSLEKAYTDKMKEALTAGYALLKEGKSSKLAVVECIAVLEQSELFNAGKGAVMTADAKHSLDASIMDGKTLNAGAVAGVEIVKNPIYLALRVMDSTEHVLLSGKGAEEFAMRQGLDTVPNSYFSTKKSKSSLERAKANEASSAQLTATSAEFKYGTVGCVALDQQGNLAAGTSTGGMTNKKWGRIGDSPIIGAGTYANNQTCAVSATGWGEYFIRNVIAYDVSALMEYAEFSLSEAAEKVIYEKLSETPATGGIIAMDNQGNISMPFNSEGMFRASIDVNGTIRINMYKE